MNRAKTCWLTGKVRFWSAARASKVKRKLPYETRIYVCRKCKGWHLTSQQRWWMSEL